VLNDQVELLVPSVVVEEFERNRVRLAKSMTASVSERFRQLKQDLEAFGGLGQANAAKAVDELARDIPLIGAMTTRNFDDILGLLRGARFLEANETHHRNVVERGLAKRAPLHRDRNSVADALIIELYASEAADADPVTEKHAFITSNSNDFSAADGDRRMPHMDLSPIFSKEGSRYALGVDGLSDVLLSHFGEEMQVIFDESDFTEEPRRLDEILGAEHELFDRIWYHRSLQYDYRLRQEGDETELERHAQIANPARSRVEAAYTAPGMLGPYSDFELGMLHGKLSALRWVLGSEWDFLDT
jgi:hypothetical protein